MSAVEASSVPRRSEHLAWQEIDGEAVVLDSRAYILRGLNPTGSRVWTLVDGTRTVADIAATLAKEWKRPSADVLGDVVNFFTVLRERGLIDLD